MLWGVDQFGGVFMGLEDVLCFLFLVWKYYFWRVVGRRVVLFEGLQLYFLEVFGRVFYILFKRNLPRDNQCNSANSDSAQCLFFLSCSFLIVWWTTKGWAETQCFSMQVHIWDGLKSLKSQVQQLHLGNVRKMGRALPPTEELRKITTSKTQSASNCTYWD